MAGEQTRAMEPPSLELKPLGREAKSLKHKHKSKRAQQQRKEGAAGGGEPKPSPKAASPGRHHAHAKRNAKANREDALRELLAGKIAEIEVGGDENLEAPIDLSGMMRRIDVERVSRN
ncbi:unnamed protein product [Phytophthora lilii]|uniref:Unnamed protein product n=1 Tax=Phytophthora lilii TaxID=2077276 RepID=A0A9W6WMS5_9STRA|nr:unnamed protein product [Phytophthora lilii]